MVRVVEAPPTKVCTCNHCKAKLAYTYADIKEEYYRTWVNGGDYLYKITCPICKFDTPVPRWST